VGYFYAAKYQPNMDSANSINISISLPALMFSVLSRESLHLQNYQEFPMFGVLIILGSGCIAWFAAKVLGVNIKTFMPPMMFSNTGNIGLPIAVLAFGEVALGAAVVLFSIEILLHFTLGASLLSHRFKLWSTLKSPVLLATVDGLLVNFIGFELWIPEIKTLDLLGQATISLLLFTLGVRLIVVNFDDWRLGVFWCCVMSFIGLNCRTVNGWCV